MFKYGHKSVKNHKLLIMKDISEKKRIILD